MSKQKITYEVVLHFLETRIDHVQIVEKRRGGGASHFAVDECALLAGLMKARTALREQFLSHKEFRERQSGIAPTDSTPATQPASDEATP